MPLASHSIFVRGNLSCEGAPRRYKSMSTERAPEENTNDSNDVHGPCPFSPTWFGMYTSAWIHVFVVCGLWFAMVEVALARVFLHNMHIDICIGA